MSPVTGHTKICFIFGDPIAQVQTPAAFNALAAARGYDAVMAPLCVRADDYPDALNMMRRLSNVAGCVVTVPHKTHTIELCDAAAARARACGGANVVRRNADGGLFADMFDGEGFAEGLRAAGRDIAQKRVLLAGAGGAAGAIAFALAERQVAEIAIANRSPARAAALTDKIARAFPALTVSAGGRDARGYDIVVNATSLGMRADDPLPIDAETLAPDMVVAEAVMTPARTGLLAAAERMGACAHPGRAMLDGQLSLIVDFLCADDAARTGRPQEEDDLTGEDAAGNDRDAVPI